MACFFVPSRNRHAEVTILAVLALERDRPSPRGDCPFSRKTPHWLSGDLRLNIFSPYNKRGVEVQFAYYQAVLTRTTC